MNNENIESPCISVCKSDPVTDYCYGCGRTTEDKKNWKNVDASNEWKKNNLQLIRSRLNNWQGEAFDKSYAFKKETGISLIKKKIIRRKKIMFTLDNLKNQILIDQNHFLITK